jgi:hypothetical protein
MKNQGRFASSILLFVACFAQASSLAPEAQYVFPTTPGQQPLATFNLTNFSFSRSGNQITISYDLPQQLVGYPNMTITLTGTTDNSSAPTELTGNRGTASCTSQDLNLVCQVTYRNLNIDLAKTDSFLRNTVSNASELQTRLDIASEFSSEPVGVVTYTFPY